MFYGDLIGLIAIGAYLAMTGTGIVLNSVLLLVFFRHPETRSPETVPLINLCFADIAYLISPLLVFILTNSHDDAHLKCLILIFCRSFVVALNIYSVASISIQRYVGLFRFRNHLPEDKRNYLHSLLILLGVWILASITATGEMLILKGIYTSSCSLNTFIIGETSYRLVLYGVVPSIIIAVFYIIAACKMRRSLNDLLSVEANAALVALQDRRRKSAKIFIALVICFAVTYLPLFILLWIQKHFLHFLLGVDWRSVAMFNSALFLSVLNPVFNPIVLCVASSKLGKFYKKYCCCCCCCCKETDVPTRSAVNHIRIGSTPGEVQFTRL